MARRTCFGSGRAGILSSDPSSDLNDFGSRILLGLLWIWTLREARSGWRLLLSATVLIIIAGAVLALAPVFRDATADRALERLLDQQSAGLFVNRVDRIRQPPTAEAAAAIDRDISAAAAQHLEGLTAEGVRLGILRFGGVNSTPQFPARFHVLRESGPRHHRHRRAVRHDGADARGPPRSDGGNRGSRRSGH